MISTESEELDYGSATLHGNYVSDQVCLDKLPFSGTKSPEYVCVEDFKFFLINSETGISNDGILGLAPQNDGYDVIAYVSALYNAELIDEEIITFTL